MISVGAGSLMIAVGVAMLVMSVQTVNDMQEDVLPPILLLFPLVGLAFAIGGAVLLFHHFG